MSDKRNIVLPAIGAFGGMFFPAIIYIFFNFDDPIALKGWAIPAATDIAFALGILALLGSRVPVSLKIFLTTLAIFDDLGAILIIAFFYTTNIHIGALIIICFCIGVLTLFNLIGVVSKTPYLLIGIIMWIATLKSGVHATLSGVILAMFIPLKNGNNSSKSPLKELEYDLHNIVAFFILPVFAFANAGIAIEGITIEQFFHNVPCGIAAGLFFGKQIGIFSLCYLSIRLKLATLPNEMNLLSLYGVSTLCGVGFTMSLFIGSLAFEETGVNLLFDERIGIIFGSIISGVLGYFLLKANLNSN